MEILLIILGVAFFLASAFNKRNTHKYESKIINNNWIECEEITPSNSYEMQVLSVIDGDSLAVSIPEVHLESSDEITRNYKTEVRLRDIDAPEFFQFGGRAAKTALEKIVSGKTIRAVAQTETDHYGRLLATIYFEDRNISLELVANGLAWIDAKYNKRQKFWSLLKQAQHKKLGIWSRNKNMPPWIYRRRLRSR